MRLSSSKSKNSESFYIIKDFVKDGKRSTKIIHKIGNIEKIKRLAGGMDYKEWLKEYVKKYKNKHYKNEIVIIEKNNQKPISKDVKTTFDIGYVFLNAIYNDLGIKDICDEIQSEYKFKFNLNEVFSYLTYARIIYPSSKFRTFKLCQSFIKAPTFKLHDEYRALSYLAENLDIIQEKIFNNSVKVLNRNSKVIYYDCTNYYFEIHQEDELRKYGYSKQHQPKPLVGMGLFLDGDGLPLAFNIHPGNKSEFKTLIPTENKILKNFKLKDTKIILCTDAGLSSDEIKKFNTDKGRAFVITQPIKKLKEDYQNEVFDNEGWRIYGDLRNVYNLDHIKGSVELRKKHFETVFYKIIQSETNSVKQDMIATFSLKYLDYQRNIRRGQIERAEKAIESNDISRKGKNQNDIKRFIKTVATTKDGEEATEQSCYIDQAIIEKEEKYDGYYAITTNLVGDVKQILNIVKGRWQIEESFRIMKHDFLARPVELSREDRIKSHFITCFVALLIYRILEQKLNKQYTTTEILDCLRTMKLFESKGDGYMPLYERTDLTDTLHEVFNFRTDYEINTYQDIEKILSNINK
ncbi:MAG: IS1634 family transposase [Bacilli bacterium]|nr:IS1634 family transposase [Bacilli bacterium]